MKRDWGIIREVLLKFEASSTPNSHVGMNSLPHLDPQAVAYNLRLLADAGCVEARIVNSSTGDGKVYAATATRLTDKGHDLLDSMRNDSVWSKIKEAFASKGLDMTVDMVIAVGRKILEAALTR